MGRSAILDKTVENLLLHVSLDSWNIGLLIGYVGEQKDYIVHIANTPIDSTEKSKGLSAISDIFVTSHAAELQRMLPGGLCICGVAATGPDLPSSYTHLQQIMLATYKKACLADKYITQATTWQLVLVDSLTKKMSSRTLYVADYKSSLSPSDVKVQSLNTGWVIADTSLSINESIYLNRDQQNQHFEQQLMNGLQPCFETITNAICLFDGELLDENDTVGVAGKGKKSSQHSLPPSRINLQLLGKFEGSAGSSCSETMSYVRIKGTISAIAFSRAPAVAGDISQAVKSDLKKSLHLRCQLLCEDILQVGSEKHASDDQLIYELPPRVYIPHESLPVTFNDYMFKDERTEDCAERAQQLLGISHIDSSSIDTSVEHSAKLKDIENHQQSKEVKSSTTHTDSSSSLMANIGRFAPIASGAAIALAVSITYLNMEDWFG